MNVDRADGVPASAPHRALVQLGRALARLGWAHGAFLFVGALTLLRYLTILLTPYGLYGDEAQYWFWAQTFDFGYYSKPPMIAWTIGLTTALCGDGEACIRASAPLWHAGTALVLFFLAKRLFDARAGFWVAAGYATLPAVWIGSIVISTDTPLLFFWALALLAVDRLLIDPAIPRGERARWAALAGAAIGLAFLSKYAVVYFLIGLALFLAADPAARRRLSLPHAALLGGTAAVFMAPNLIWNALNGFKTVSHTADNANWRRDLFHPDHLLHFVGDQIAIFGPVLFAALVWGLITWRRRAVEAGGDWRRNVFLLCFALPPIAIVGVQAFISRAHANWAATAYVAGLVLVTVWLLRRGVPGRRWLTGSLALHLFAGAVFTSFVLSPGLADALGRANDFKRVRGWEALTVEIESRLDAAAAAGRPFEAIVVDDRMSAAQLLYYARDLDAPVFAWNADGDIDHHFELVRGYQDHLARGAAGETILYLTRRGRFGVDGTVERFALARPGEPIILDLGGGKTRRYEVYRLEGLTSAAAPIVERTDP